MNAKRVYMHGLILARQIRVSNDVQQKVSTD